jgi:hypothetical protein
MKTCPGCKTEKPYEEFGKTKATKSGLSARCKACNRKKGNERYWRRINNFWENRDKKCERCKKEFPIYILEFHHIDPDGKEGTVTSLIGNACSKERVEKELAKCEQLCANCHNTRHYEMRTGEKVEL